ncbi:MAG: hypothetical protein ACE5MH_03545 [Terriglobia bacterium]
MISTYDVIILALSVVLSLGTVGVCLRQKCFLRYALLNLYLLVSAVFTLGCWYFIQTYGYESAAYFYFYFTGDVIGTTIAYLVVASLFDQMFRQSIFRDYVRPTLAIFFFLVVGVSALAISRSISQFSSVYTVFVTEFEQNMYFVGVLLTFLLWLSMMYLGAETRRFVLLVSGLGIYFTAHAASYAAIFLFRSVDPIATRALPIAYNLMVLVWLYAFLVVPEGEPARELGRRRGWAALQVPVHENKTE